MSRVQRSQRPLPGVLSAPAARGRESKAKRKEAPNVVQRGFLLRAKEAAVGTRLPKVIGGIDPVLFGVVAALIVFGVVMVYSASSVRSVRMYGDAHHFLLRQVLYAAVGVPLLLGLARFDYHRLRGLGLWALSSAVLLLIAVVLGAGRHAGGAARWIQIGPINVQPAEVTKLALILWLSESLAKKAGKLKNPWIGFVPHALVVAGLVLLCMLQPDFGSSVVLVMLTFILLFVAGVKLGYMVLGAAALLPLVYYALRLSPYRWQRVMAFTDPFKYRQTGGYQIVESWFSFGAGGLSGVGLGDSRQKLLFLPEAHTDFIAAIVGEELGFIGFSLLVFGFVVVVLRGLRAAFRAPDDHGLFLGLGLTMFIGLQAVINLAVVLGLVPTKGLTLPFLSFGGSSLLVNCAAVGILLNVSRPRLPLTDERSRIFGDRSLGFAERERSVNPRVRERALDSARSAEGGLT